MDSVNLLLENAMTMLDIHSAATSSRISSYHEFLSRYTKNAKVVYGFVEGKEDPAFYRGFIELLLPEDWTVELWPAGGKDRVYQIHSDLDWRRFPKTRIGFFVDRDLSDMIPEKLIQDSNIYVTAGYSIENDVASKAVCRRVLSELCGLAKLNHSELDKACGIFEQEREKFFKSMIPVMAWILHWRRCGKRAHLGDILMEKLFSFHLARLQVKSIVTDNEQLAQYLHSQCGVEIDANADIEHLIGEFRAGGHYKKFTRGKYLLWFLVEFCNSVHRDAARIFSGIDKAPKKNVTLSCSNGMALVGPRARIPKSLREFLNASYCIYIERIEARASKR